MTLSAFALPTLPAPLGLYFEISNGADDARLVDCFAADAVVRDESQTHHGPKAIQGWLREARRKYQHHVEPLSLTRDGARVTVAGKVSGNFPGSPLKLNHVFDLRDDKIQSLEIHG
ncbi:nuclear transport factor 2 family protein [Hylemonella gracilis]|uniref:Nuclear transport factor 2 family protein n=1 Tax=Hylemonella gracilis TaxID=80880 RepID=A0A4P6UKC7_9BURK|nr:nuclear transport factor 2 family protein [Hylemonella gracilis]QBK05036.1 nuclear transport factor 2 family protein [Hylemonella gracilis]